MKILFYMVHGIGTYTKREVYTRGADLLRSIVKENPRLRGKIELKALVYSDILQPRQIQVWDKMVYATNDFGRRRWHLIRWFWLRLRQFLLYNMADALIIEHQAHLPNSVYKQTMDRFRQEFMDGWQEISESERDETIVVVMADSLGAHLVSNYIWDRQADLRQLLVEPTVFADMSLAEIEQFTLRKLRLLVTTGCNIPLFVSGMEKIQGIENDSLGYNFKWLNIFDNDDLLGWPLRPLGDYFDSSRVGKTYSELVEDEQINVWGGLRGYFLQSWNPFSHWLYWETPAVAKRVALELDRIIGK